MKKILFIAAAFIAACVILIASLNIYVICDASNYILNEPELGEEKYDCILILGAGLRADGTPSDMLRDRLDTGIGLYRLGHSDVLLLSGDCSGEDYDEVSAMKNYCLSNGVPEEDIVCDNEGFSTFESVCNTWNSDAFERIIVVTQEYHLSRAIYIARGLNLDAVGICADRHSYRGQIYRDAREAFARTKDFFQTVNRQLMRIK